MLDGLDTTKTQIGNCGVVGFDLGWSLDWRRLELNMKRLKLVGAVLGAPFAVVAMGASASALTLPDMSVTLGGTYPLHGQGSASAELQFGSAAGVTMEGKGVTVLGTATELSALGTFMVIFNHVELPRGEACETNSLGKGNVELTGESHDVPLNTTGTTGDLELVTEAKILCGALTVTVRGDIIGSLKATSGEVTSVKGGLTGSKGAPGITEYINDGGTKVKAALEEDVGVGFVAAYMNISEEITADVSGSQMIEISNQ